jgi:tetratricopeptide (TPR) repeat protein
MKFSVPEIAKAVMQKLPSILQFLGKILFPVNMSVFTTVKDTTIIYGIVVLVFIYVALWFTKNRRYSYAIFGASWFLLFLMPSFITEFSVVSTYLEERIYLSLIGFIIVLLETDVVNKAFQNRRSAAIFGAMIILLFTAITFNYSKDYRNRIAYWESAVKNAQSSPLAHRNLGAMYYLDGIKDKAEMEFVKSLELNKNEPMAHNNIGILLMEKGDLKGAETEYKKEIEINPMFPNVYYNLGLLYYKENRLNEASAVWEKAIETNPNYIDAYYNLAVVYYVQGKYNECAIYVRYLKDKGVKLDSKLLSVIKE